MSRTSAELVEGLITCSIDMIEAEAGVLLGFPWFYRLLSTAGLDWEIEIGEKYI